METHSNINIIKHYFPDTPASAIIKFEKLYSIYKEINSKINLISRKDIDNFYLHHVIHSLSIAKIFTFKENTQVLDIGTGGGFPGIPLAILFPKVTFTLVDSIKKKIDAISQITKDLQLNNAILINDRAENINNKFDFVVSRAVGKLDYLIKLTKNIVNKTSFNDIKNGLICLKGGDITDEINNINYRHKVYTISNFFADSFFENKLLVYIPIAK